MIKILKDCWKPRPTYNIEESLSTLKEVSSLLKQQISKYDTDLNANRIYLKESIKKRESKNSQLYYLKKVKLYEHHMKSAMDRLLALDQQQLNLESIKLTTLHLDAVKLTTKTLHSYMRQTDVEKVEDLTDKLADYIANATDISNLLNENMDANLDIDDEELEKELATFEQTSDNVKFPVIPHHKPGELIEVDLSGTTSSTPLIVKNQDLVEL